MNHPNLEEVLLAEAATKYAGNCYNLKEAREAFIAGAKWALENSEGAVE
jgi:hypothetical protein